MYYIFILSLYFLSFFYNRKLVKINNLVANSNDFTRMNEIIIWQ